MLIGYARVSTSHQDTSLQLRALRRSGVRRVFQEKTSSVSSRPQLQLLLSSVQPGDMLTVYKLDRLARSLKDLLGILERLHAARCGFRSLTEPIDTSTPAGRLMLQMLGAVAEFERSLIRERSIAGQVAAIERGVKVGRPRHLTSEQEREIFELWKFGGWSKLALSREYNVHEGAIRRAVYIFERPGHPLTVPNRPVLGPLLARVN